MNTTALKTAIEKLGWLVATMVLLLAGPSIIRVARANAAQEAAHGSDDGALRQVVAGFSDGWNNHDAHAMCASVAEDVRWVGWRGDIYESRKSVEDNHAMLFADLYRKTHRTDVVKFIHYLAPDLAMVDDYWTMTGARTRAGADWPYREGYANFLMAKRGGRWTIIISHTADFNAKAPEKQGDQ